MNEGCPNCGRVSCNITSVPECVAENWEPYPTRQELLDRVRELEEARDFWRGKYEHDKSQLEAVKLLPEKLDTTASLIRKDTALARILLSRALPDLKAIEFSGCRGQSQGYRFAADELRHVLKQAAIGDGERPSQPKG